MTTRDHRARLERTGTLLLTLAASAAPASAQTWAEQSGSPAVDVVEDITADGTGGYYVVGYTQGSYFGPLNGSGDGWLAHRSANGALLSGFQLGMPNSDWIEAVAPDGAGGVLLAITYEVSLPNPPWWAKRIRIERRDANWAQLWADDFWATGNDVPLDACADGAGGMISVGRTYGSLFGASAGGTDVWIARHDADGNRLWGRQLGSPGGDNAFSVTSDGSGGALVCGSTSGVLGTTQTLPESEAWYARYDDAGNLLWVRQFGSGEGDACRAIEHDGLGGYVLLGTTSGVLAAGGGGQSDVFLRRVDGSGNTLWTRQFGAALQDYAAGLLRAPDGSVYAAGETTGPLFGPYGGASDIWVVRYDVDGNPLGALQLGSTGADFVDGVTSDGGLGAIVGGWTQGDLFAPPMGFGDAWSARFDGCDLAPSGTYCTASPNSTGQGASIAQLGSTALSSNDFTLQVSYCPPGQLGIFLMGTQQTSTPFGNGVLCLGGSVARLLPAQVVDGTGSVSLPLDFGDLGSPASQITPGSTWNFQFWYRDLPAGGAEFNLSNGLSATFCP